TADDITDRKTSAQAQLTYSGAVLALAHVISLDGSLESALQVLAQQLGFSYTELWQVDAQYNVLRVGAIWHEPSPALQRLMEHARRQVLAKGRALAGRCWALESPIYLPDLDSTGVDRPELEIGSEFHSGLAFPVRLAGRLAGVAVLLHRGRAGVRAPS